MLKISHLLKFISEMNPQNTPTRLCFFNFLRGFPQSDEVLTSQYIEQFFNYCLDYPHWAANRNLLGGEVKSLLQHFNSFYQHSFDYSTVRFPHQIQLIEIEQNVDLIEAARQYCESLSRGDDRVQIILDQGKKIVALILREDKSLEVRTFDRKWTIRQGRLEPLRADLVLYYNSAMELQPNKIHRIEIAPYITAQFSMIQGQMTGLILRGYVFQKLVEFKNEDFSEKARLFYPIKHLESFFVRRETDPYYNDLIQQSEKVIALARNQDPQALQMGQRLQSQVESALEYIYNDDKHLQRLVKEFASINNHLKANESWQNQKVTTKSDSINI